MSNRVTAYPYKRIKPSACLWDELEIIYPEDCSLENLSAKWDYDVDLQFKVSVELSEIALTPEQLAGVEKFMLAIDVHCPSTMWRGHEVATADMLTEAGTRRFSATVNVPGNMVSESLEVKPSLVGPVAVPFFDRPISQVVLLDGPTKSVVLENSLFYFPTSILSFSEANWASAPWRFELTPQSMDDLYANSSRLYINSDKKISEILRNSDGDALNSTAITAITRDLLLVTLMKLSGDQALREECRESDFSPGSVGQVVSKQVMDLFGRSLDAVITEFEKNPLFLMMQLDAGSNYFAKGI
ncbi:hypothetical protein [Glutamicibacter sp. HZAU]|uniref:hypothetical protein n=1 Tax=Glutamicibacter sp. HZAU TaxID=2049891 RepID=UPI000FFC073D|nr:hypothetical protein [Glutamicibacter sp. HZAU]RWZ85300.1 hypothetical protein EKH49_02000 [Glutamicibacter sp. HZAU]